VPTLNWIGKDAVEKHHREVPFRLVERVDELSCGDTTSGNLIVQGDNLHALKALLPRYAGQVKCIYIDPPYNTGMDDRNDSGKRTGWVYNDNVDSPEIREWLGKVVGAESEDLSRHDKWLCMILPRLKLLKSFLRDDGVIFVSIDENEYGNLRVIMDELFGISNRIGTIIWKNATDNNPTKIAVEHEYVLCYANKIQALPKEWKSPNLTVKQLLIDIGNEFISKYPDQEERQKEYTKWFREHKSELWPFDRYKFIDDEGIYTGSQSVHNPGKDGYRYDVIHPETKKACKQPLMGYRFPETTMNELLESGRVIFGKDEKKLIELKVYAKDYRAKLSSLFELDGRKGTNQIKEIFPEDKRPFDFPKPTDLIEELISFTTNGNDIVLDSFAGSGTTGHAVLLANKADGQNRKFILTEMKEHIAKTITQPRLSRVISGYTKANGEKIKPLASGFEYFQLSEKAMFDAAGPINSDVNFEQLSDFVWFMETGTARNKSLYSGTPLIGNDKGRAVFLLFNGILKDRTDIGGNVLNSRTLSLLEEVLPNFEGPRVVYGARSRFDKSKLKELGITFHQLPYELAVKTWF